MVEFTCKLNESNCLVWLNDSHVITLNKLDWMDKCNTPNKSTVNTAYKQDCTWNSWIVFSWQVASHIAHCTPRMYCTEHFIAVLPTDLRTVLQNTRGSESTGSSVICRTTGNKSNNWARLEQCYKLTWDLMFAISSCIICTYGFVIISQRRPTSLCGLC